MGVNTLPEHGMSLLLWLLLLLLLLLQLLLRLLHSPPQVWGDVASRGLG